MSMKLGASQPSAGQSSDQNGNHGAQLVTQPPRRIGSGVNVIRILLYEAVTIAVGAGGCDEEALVSVFLVRATHPAGSLARGQQPLLAGDESTISLALSHHRPPTLPLLRPSRIRPGFVGTRW